MVWGAVQKILFFSCRKVPSPGWSGKQVLLTPPRTIFFLERKKLFTTSLDHFVPVGGPGGPQKTFAFLGGFAIGPPLLNFLNMSFVGHVTWKCILFSDLKTLEVFTIFGSENFEVFTIFESVDPGSAHYFQI